MCIKLADLENQIFEGFVVVFWDLRWMLQILYSIALLLCHMLANFLLATLPPNSLHLMFGMIIHYLSYMDQKSKLPTLSTNLFQDCKLSTVLLRLQVQCLKIYSFPSQNCLHVSVSTSFLSHSSKISDSSLMPWPPFPL